MFECLIDVWLTWLLKLGSCFLFLKVAVCLRFPKASSMSWRSPGRWNSARYRFCWDGARVEKKNNTVDSNSLFQWPGHMHRHHVAEHNTEKKKKKLLLSVVSHYIFFEWHFWSVRKNQQSLSTKTYQNSWVFHAPKVVGLKLLWNFMVGVAATALKCWLRCQEIYEIFMDPWLLVLSLKKIFNTWSFHVDVFWTFFWGVILTILE